MDEVLIERAARAICALDPDKVTQRGEPMWKVYVPCVRLVLAAIMEPAGGMLSDGAFQIFRGERITEDDLASAKRVWKAMVRRMLKDGADL